MVEYNIKSICPIKQKLAAFFHKSLFIVRAEKYICYNKKAGWGLRTTVLGKRRPYGVGDGTIRKSVGDFL